MPRIPYAAQTLIDQVVQAFPDTEVHHHDLDGLEVYRTIEFRGEAATAWLVKGDLALLLDKRVVSAQTVGDAFVVTFVADPRSDYSTPFPVDSVAAMAEEMPEEPVEDDDDRERGLRATSVADLRKTYPEHADLSKKKIIEAILADEN